MPNLLQKSSPDSPYLIVGLGNPGERYARTRHNIGFRCLEQLAARYGIEVRRKRFDALIGEGRIEGRRVVLAQPQTYMNDSGKAVRAIARWYKVPLERLLVIYDELDLPLGRIRLRPHGSSGGHRGLGSVIQLLGTEQFPRLRVGIGRPAQGDPIDYVLGAISPSEEPLVDALCERVTEIVLAVITQGVEQAMNTYNGLSLAPAHAADTPASGDKKASP